MSEALAKKAAEILDRKKIIVIATVGKDGQPWNTPVAGFRFSGDINFYWTSWEENQHSKNIRENKKVFIIVFDEESAEGVYCLANAYQINDEEETLAVAKVFGSDKYNSSDGREYLGNKPRKIYKAVPTRAWINADKRDVAGKFLHDTRVEIDLRTLKTSVK